MNSTNEFSFTLRPSTHGVGVFAEHDIEKGTHLRLFAEEKVHDHKIREFRKEEIPEHFRTFCISRGDILICPPDFGAMPIGWHLNHSSTPSAVKGESVANRKYAWYAARDIKKGEEITIDYNSLEEPEEAKEDFYKTS